MAHPFTADAGQAFLIPNIIPNEKFLPKADYGYVAALRIVGKIFPNRINAYLSPAAGNIAAAYASWQKLGQYHYRLATKDLPTLGNEYRRIFINNDPTEGDYAWPQPDDLTEIQGPPAFDTVLRDIRTIANVYNIHPQILTSAIVQSIASALSTVGAVPGPEWTGWQTAVQYIKYRPDILFGLWGVKGNGYPKSFNHFQGYSTREDYKGGKRGRNGSKKGFKKGRKKRRRY